MKDLRLVENFGGTDADNDDILLAADSTLPRLGIEFIPD